MEWRPRCRGNNDERASFAEKYVTGMNYNDTSVETARRHYFSSSHGPFHNANNIFMFYGGGDRGRIVESIIRSIRADESLIHVHGEPGSGKTLLSLVISDRMKIRYSIIRYDLPDISESLLLRHLLIELCPQNADLISAENAQVGASKEAVSAALMALINQLNDSSGDRIRKPFVLVVDSLAELDESTLAIIEQLTAVRVSGRAIVHCVIFDRNIQNSGSATFYKGEALPVNHYCLRRLTLAEMNEYLRHHMLLFDFNRRDLFTREMAYFIADRSEGVFRSINKLARNAFTIANLEAADKVSMSHLLLAGLPPRTENSIESSFLARHRAGVIALMGSCVVASTAAAVFLMR